MKFSTAALAVLSVFRFAAGAPKANEEVFSIGSSSAQKNDGIEVKDLLCTLYLKDVQEDGAARATEVWTCKLSDEDHAEYGISSMEIEGPGVKKEWIDSKDPTSGFSMLKASEAFISKHGKMFVPNMAEVDVVPLPEDFREEARRRLAPSSGSLKTLVVRVVANGVGPTANKEQMVSDVFTDSVNLKERYASCSYDALEIVPFDGTTSSGEVVTDGVVDIPIYVDPNSGSSLLETEAYNAATSTLGNLGAQFDLVMFCQPRSSATWLAYAYVNSFDSYYNDEWCNSVSAQVHEVGHNLGLAHSGEGGAEYGDQSGFMGLSYDSDDAPLMCFNPAKNFQLGWYSDQQVSINPAATGSRSFTMNGISDYRTNPANTVVLHLEQPSLSTDYFVGYNRATGINSGTLEGQNKLYVVRRDGNPGSYGPSLKEAELSAGQELIFENFDNSGLIVKLKCIAISDADASVEVEVINPIPTISPAPTQACTDFLLELTMDTYPEDISWSVKDDANDETVAEGGSYSTRNALAEETACLPQGCYTFMIDDSYSDGLCCSYGNGGYVGYLGGVAIPDFSGGDFGAGDMQKFCVGPVTKGDPTPSPTKSPTKSPTLSPTQSPTKSPTQSPTKSPTQSPTKSPTKAPTASPTGSSPTGTPPTGSPPDSGCQTIRLDIVTDWYASETTWTLELQAGSDTIASGGDYGSWNTLYQETAEVCSNNCYTLTIFDSWGDGICCSYGNGSYAAFLDDVPIDGVSGGEFDDFVAHDFCI